MCRILLYVSNLSNKPRMRVKYLLNDAVHSLGKQSYKKPYVPGIDLTKPKMKARNPQFNMDGFGLVFEVGGNLLEYRSPLAIVNKGNHRLKPRVAKLITDERTNFLMAIIRNNNFKHKFANNLHIPPYNFGSYFFVHNGGFNGHIKEMGSKLRAEITPNLLKVCKPKIDSQYLFCYLLSGLGEFHLLTPDEICEKMTKLVSKLDKIRPKDFGISLVFMLSDVEHGVHLVLRYRMCKEPPPSLYYNRNFRKGFVVASEPINHQEGWKLLSNSLIVIKDHKFKIFNIYNRIKCRR